MEFGLDPDILATLTRRMYGQIPPPQAPQVSLGRSTPPGDAPIVPTGQPNPSILGRQQPDSMPVLGRTGQALQTARDRQADLVKQGAPKYGILGRILDTLVQGTGLGRMIERGAGVGTLGYEDKLGRANRDVDTLNKELQQEGVPAYQTAETAKANADAGRTNVQTDKMRADMDAPPDPGTPEERTYNDLLKQTNPATGKPYTSQEALEIVKSAGKQDKTPAAKNTKEQLQAQLVEASNRGDTAEVARLQKQIKDIDPLGEQRVNISVQSQTDRENAAAQKQQGPETAVAFANDYMAKDANGKYIMERTGSNDEALMEKFFEMAKPSSGFRMTEAQMNMLRQARSWKDSLEAQIRHVVSGTWFSDEQREQIAQTMIALGKADDEARSSRPSRSRGKQQSSQPYSGGPPPGAKVRDYTTVK